MEVALFVESQEGANYEQLLHIAAAAEAVGFHGFFTSDHLLAEGSIPTLGPTDALLTLAGLARETASIRLGTLVSPVTFRPPAPLAVSIAQLDAMSGGRIELGLGAGWYRAEHEAMGVAFPSVVDRFQRLEEALVLILELWGAHPGGSVSYAGAHYQIERNPALPRPVQKPWPPLIVGGRGAKHAPRLAARYATELNVPLATPDLVGERFALATRLVANTRRDPRPLRRSATVTVACATRPPDVRRRRLALNRFANSIRATPVIGNPEQVSRALLRYADVGAQRIYLQCLDTEDVDHVILLGTEVIPLIVSRTREGRDAARCADT